MGNAMGRLPLIGLLFVIAGLCEIGVGYLVWGWLREHRALCRALCRGLPGAAVVLAGVLLMVAPPRRQTPKYNLHATAHSDGRGRQTSCGADSPAAATDSPARRLTPSSA